MASVEGVQARLCGAAEAPRRADARRSLVRLIEAAQQAVEEAGLQVTAHDLAARAGVGVGTFYRQVPSRQALLRAVLEDLLADIAAVAERALAHPDAWAGFCEFARAYVHLRGASCGVNEALNGEPGFDLDATVDALRERLRRLVSRAQLEGVLRPDVSWSDVAFLLASAVPVGHTLGLAPDADQWRRSVGVLLDGLRAAPARPAPGE